LCKSHYSNTPLVFIKSNLLYYYTFAVGVSAKSAVSVEV